MWIVAMALCARGSIEMLDDPTVVVFAARGAEAVVDGVKVAATDEDGALSVGNVMLEPVAVKTAAGCSSGRWRALPGPRTRTGLHATLTGTQSPKEFARGVVRWIDGNPHEVRLFVDRGFVTIESDFAHGGAEPWVVTRDTSWLFAVGERHRDVQQRLALVFADVPFRSSVVAALAAHGKLTVKVGEYLHEEAHRDIGEMQLAYVREVP